MVRFRINLKGEYLGGTLVPPHLGNLPSLRSNPSHLYGGQHSPVIFTQFSHNSHNFPGAKQLLDSSSRAPTLLS